MTCDDIRAQLAAYALDALSPDEARSVEAHLATCPECRRDLAVLREAAAHLAMAPAATPAPAELRDRVMAAIEAERRGGAGRSPGAGAAVPLRRAAGGWSRVAQVALVAAAMVIVVLGAQVVRLEQRLATIEREAARTNQVASLMADPGTRTVELTGSQAGAAAPGGVRLIYNPGRRTGLLVASQLPDPGADRVYQLWLVGAGAPVSAGVFRPQPGQPEILGVGAEFSRYAAVAVSVERGPNGAPAPTSTPILVGKLPRG